MGFLVLSRGFFSLMAIIGLLLPLQAETEMLGPLTREAVLKDCPDWQEVVARYQPDGTAIDGLRAFNRPVQVEVFLGTWCPDSKAHVSEFFKVLDLAENAVISTTYVGIPRDKAQRPQYYQGKDIQKLPTFLVFMNGREKGRIVEVPKKSIEQDLLDILLR
jgi:thiol-disulfide isomerase/thioredoxin